jgi:hypothetical protein
MNNLNSFETHERVLEKKDKKNPPSHKQLNEYLTRHINEETGSVLIIFHPPKEVGQETNILKVKLKNPILEKDTGNLKQDNSFDYHDDNEFESEDDFVSDSSKGIPERLTEPDSTFQSSTLATTQGNPQPLIEESTTLEEAFALEEEGLENLDNKPHLMALDLSLMEKFSSILEESSPVLDESTSLDDEWTSACDESISLVEGSSFAQDMATLLGIDETLNDENLLCKDSPLDREESLQDLGRGSPLDPFSSNFEESSSLDNEFSSMLANAYSNDDESASNEESYISEKRKHQLQDCFQKTRCPIVKLPVLISKLDIDIDIFDELKLLWPITSVMKTEWSIQSLDCFVLLPSTKVFLKGIFVAEINYVNHGLKQTIHTVKIPVFWNKVVNIDWLYQPILSSNKSKEYAFHSTSTHDISIHREFYQEYSEQIQHELKSVHFVCHEELVHQSENPNLQIQGRAILSIDFFQKQYISLNASDDSILFNINNVL